MINIKKEFYKYIENLEEELNKDEWYLNKFRENIIKNISTVEAFDIIPDVTQLLLEQEDEFLCTEIFELLLSLARKSNSTELCFLLNENWEEIEKIMQSYGDYSISRMDELKRWYRKN